MRPLSAYPELARVDVIGVPITATNMHECLGFIQSHLDEMRGEYICVSNAHTCVMAHDDPEYWKVQAGSVMSVPDGKPLSVVGRRSIGSMDRVTGPDLMREILQMSAERGWSHFFYGNTAENLSALVEATRGEYPGLEIAGYEPSIFRELSDDEVDELAMRVNASGADFMWVAIGAPRQELLMSRLRGKAGALMVGVGGAFNILAGITPEAPLWVQNIGLEWLYRLIQEPKRLFKRYFVTNSKFIAYQITGKRRKEAA